MIQIKGNVKFPITLDPSTWIFDDRKVTVEEMEQGKKTGVAPIKFKDNREWNRDILEGASKPPTLNSEKKFKKQALLEGTFVINMEPFFVNAEPGEDAAVIALSNEETTEEIALTDLTDLYFQFSKEGKRLYQDGMVDAFVYNNGYKQRINHVTAITIK
ncbi:hypothetical protein [Macrococcus equipercicus]|uniref:Peptidyl-prolyl cis-trans isomerase n=1 Tax=Macrococcus equipercicus TaxID=69967 RepID=A0A9Q9F274_9STAP|nr:hypothetical protein [Macrococcus equipercicus]KAA1042798.1 hypothetical protein ERX35_002020 [Macrococcus equipercicus]UTH14848.1 hypothetical protein KFV11_04080 [Macrococcus equipercicus]